ncbi:MAG: PAS sensor domain-containing protein [Sulfuricurvum sp. PD_MW2]|uniref:PAS domain-containing protein n=1 Tax=Sulfuricurvum sp. PD_MW2 TaxID=2027917 RepID=UPI000C05F2DE|nr:PAS domain-containing protein [Sulfuricurvum sp. PD_MW2]PHM16489.1 MAG: PAS sensor domain-containing protein [Sulfuricurvum sp. PD_MW2]
MAEIQIDDKCVIVSETDEKGIITFANDDFIRYSGYTREELMGKPHNILRHSDMPKAAFADLWATIKAGKTWNGFVKNKTKNGDFYWVYATASKVVAPDGSIRYISLRNKPTKQEAQKYDTLYKTMK